MADDETEEPLGPRCTNCGMQVRCWRSLQKHVCSNNSSCNINNDARAAPNGGTSNNSSNKDNDELPATWTPPPSMRIGQRVMRLALEAHNYSKPYSKAEVARALEQLPAAFERFEDFCVLASSSAVSLIFCETVAHRSSELISALISAIVASRAEQSFIVEGTLQTDGSMKLLFFERVKPVSNPELPLCPPAPSAPAPSQPPPRRRRHRRHHRLRRRHRLCRQVDADAVHKAVRPKAGSDIYLLSSPPKTLDELRAKISLELPHGLVRPALV